MKRIEEMTLSEMKDELRQFIIGNKDHLADENYVFISYSHRDSEEVYRKVLYWMRQGYNIYIDLDFENHSSGEDWVSIMKKTVRNPRCKLAVCFRSVHYYYSYAALLELLTMYSDQATRDRKSKMLELDLIELEYPAGDLTENIPAALREGYKENFKRLRQEMGAHFAQNNDPEKRCMEAGLREWLESLSDATIADKLEGNDAASLWRMISNYYESGAVDFYTTIAYIMQKWFVTHNFKGNTKDKDTTAEEGRFDSLGVYRDAPPAPEPPDPTPVTAWFTPVEKIPLTMSAPEEAKSVPTLTAEPAAPAKRRGRPPKGAAPAASVYGISKEQFEAAPEQPDLAADATLAQIRALFSDTEAVRRFRAVRENLPRGGKGAMDYLMAAALGGCNEVKRDSPSYQINYYLYAVAAQEAKNSGSLGATWTWSSNCRKVLGLEKSGQIPAEYNSFFAALPADTPLSRLAEDFAAGSEEAFRTQRAGLIVLSANRLSEFLKEELPSE